MSSVCMFIMGLQTIMNIAICISNHHNKLSQEAESIDITPIVKGFFNLPFTLLAILILYIKI